VNAARAEGVPVAQYVREAALIRVAWEARLRQGTELTSAEGFEDAVMQARRAARQVADPG
jgi:hypothetical protein